MTDLKMGCEYKWYDEELADGFIRVIFWALSKGKALVQNATNEDDLFWVPRDELKPVF